MHFTPRFHHLCLSSAVGVAALLAACGGGGGDTPQGTLQVSMTDAPACGFKEVNVTVTKVRVHQASDAGESASGWKEIVLAPAKKINLLDLTNGRLEPLGDVTLPAGRYTQMRLVLAQNNSAAPTANSVMLDNGTTEIALDTPSGVQSGIKLIRPFDVAADATVGLVLDFDACRSIVTKGNGGYALKPVIQIIDAASSGGITGYVPTGLTNAIVSAQQDGVVVKSTVPDATGKFNLSPLPPNATGYVVVVAADGSTTAAITGVPVTTGIVTQVSSDTARINVPTSSVRTISGTVTPASSQALVRTTQTYSSGPKVEVTFKSADSVNGSYSLSAPTAAPLLGSFGALPITLTADTGAAGKYTIEASATGYATQSFSADVGTADVTQNFTLATTP